MMTLLKNIYLFLFRTKTFAGRQKLPLRMFFHKVFRVVFYPWYSRRKSILEKDDISLSGFAIPEDKGYQNLTGLDPELTQEVVSEAKRMLSGFDLEELKRNSDNKHLINIPIRENLNRENPFMKFALHKKLTHSIGKYIGMLPVIENIMIWYSPNENNFDGSSQEYHLDGQDVRTLQVFMLLGDVTNENGPLTFIDADESEKVASKIGYKKAGNLKRLTDEDAEKDVPGSAIHKLTGKAGECYVVDTDRCFHYGSREGTQPRFLVVFQYYTPFAFVLPWRWWKKLPYAKAAENASFSERDRLLLGSH